MHVHISRVELSATERGRNRFYTSQSSHSYSSTMLSQSTWILPPSFRLLSSSAIFRLRPMFLNAQSSLQASDHLLNYNEMRLCLLEIIIQPSDPLDIVEIAFRLTFWCTTQRRDKYDPMG